MGIFEIRFIFIYALIFLHISENISLKEECIVFFINCFFLIFENIFSNNFLSLFPTLLNIEAGI